MSVNGTAAYGMYPRNVALPEVVYALNRAGFESEDICMVLSPAHPVATVVRDAKILDAELEESASSARMIGWFSEFGACDSDGGLLHSFAGILPRPAD
jgi:hypothetical protein